MNEETRSHLTEHLEILCCPRCAGAIEVGGEGVSCTGCGESYPVTHNIPQMFAPNDWDASQKDVTEAVKAFYEETPFPSYDDFDSVGSLIQKARQGRFAKQLDDQIPPAVRILEIGCGTGQLSNFLSIANRTVFGTDMCLNSLRLGQKFKEQNSLKRAHFLQMNLFRPVFRRETFPIVISNGVLHHTSDPFLAFQLIAKLVKPKGYILVGLYHRYGRLITDLRRRVFHLTGNRFTSLDPNLRSSGHEVGSAKWRAWFMDQYKNPHESKHTIGEVMGWLRKTDFDFVRSLPRSKPFQPFSQREHLFDPEAPGNWLDRLVVELGMIPRGSREGGFFVVIGRKRAPPPERSPLAEPLTALPRSAP